MTTPRRSVALPDVPTIAEAGLPGYAASGWYGLVAPAGTPRATIERLNNAVRSAIRPAEMKDKLAGIGVEVVDATPGQFGELITIDIAKWEKIVKPMKITPE